VFERSEADVIRNWHGDAASPVVSVCCIAYNHQDYIANALDSLLAQETNFPFEVLIHDDASTDNTTEVIRHYAETYPRIIRTILQEENQYSQKPIISPRFLFPLVRGEYVAICEGDDYWCSANKLMIQYQALQRSPDVNLSFHPVFKLDDNAGRKNVVGRFSENETRLDSATIILGGGGFCPTASIMFRSSIIPDIISCVENAPVSDKFLQIVASLGGGALFLPQTMAVYRAGHEGAWTRRINHSERLKQYESHLRYPYEWLTANSPDALLDVLKFSEADQYARIAKNYLLAGDPDSAQRTLMTSAGLFPQGWFLRGLVSWAARGSLRTRIYMLIYPAFRSLFRHRVRSSASKS